MLVRLSSGSRPPSFPVPSMKIKMRFGKGCPPSELQRPQWLALPPSFTPAYRHLPRIRATMSMRGPGLRPASIHLSAVSILRGIHQRGPQSGRSASSAIASTKRPIPDQHLERLPDAHHRASMSAWQSSPADAIRKPATNAGIFITTTCMPAHSRSAPARERVLDVIPSRGGATTKRRPSEGTPAIKW
jgi:hypothetical protein